MAAPANKPVATAKQPSSPFRGPKADIILRSSSGISFYAHKAILSDVSSVFSDMFSMPQPPENTSSQDGLPFVDLSEDSETLDLLLLISYPGTASTVEIDNLGLVPKVLVAADKYNMAKTKTQLMHILQNDQYWIERAPFRMYVLACQLGHGGREIAKTAAKETLLHPAKVQSCSELANISGATYHNLLTYRQQHIEAMEHVLENWTCIVSPRHQPLQPGWMGGCDGTGSSKCASSEAMPISLAALRKYTSSSVLYANGGKHPPLWFVDHLERIKAGFQDCVSPSVATSPAILETTVNGMLRSQCMSCPRKIPVLMEFGARLQLQLDAAFSKIVLKFES